MQRLKGLWSDVINHHFLGLSQVKKYEKMIRDSMESILIAYCMLDCILPDLKNGWAMADAA